MNGKFWKGSLFIELFYNLSDFEGNLFVENQILLESLPSKSLFWVNTQCKNGKYGFFVLCWKTTTWGEKWKKETLFELNFWKASDFEPFFTTRQILKQDFQTYQILSQRLESCHVRNWDFKNVSEFELKVSFRNKKRFWWKEMLPSKNSVSEPNYTAKLTFLQLCGSSRSMNLRKNWNKTFLESRHLKKIRFWTTF